ncbi:dioxygenase [Microbacterium sp.]|uniref:dioxygenase n=1 Tax=Microbacterium sp. TaxID=51671 RepID=UPI003C727266
MASGARKGSSRVEQERARAYRARQEFHAALIARRRRDNLVAGIAGGALILAIVGGQLAYYTLGPGAPIPTPTDSPSPTSTVMPTPGETPTPTP